MRLVDDVILDPAEIAEGRTELNLSKMGLSVINADFGETAIEATAIRTGLGQTLVDRKPKPRTIVFDLMVREDAEADLATAAYRLQQKIGLMMQRGGWLRRDFIYGNFKGSLLYKVTGEVTLDRIGGWHNGDSSVDPTLSFVCDLVGYSTEEREQGPFTSAAGARHLIFTEVASPGSADGLWRGHITNNGSEDWRGLIYSRECEFAPEELSDPTAQPAYLAKNLTPKGGAAVKTVSGVEIVEYAELPADWLPILSSEIAGVGHMTHRGPRAMWMRIYDPGSEPGGVQLQLQWRALGASRWDELMPIVSTPVTGGWMLVSLGTARPEVAVLGGERWEFRLLARAPSGTGSIRIRDVYSLSTEQLALVSEPVAGRHADVAITKKAAGTVIGNSSENGGTIEWVNPANAKTSDNAYATATRTAGTPETSKGLKLTNWGFVIPGGAVILGVSMDFEAKASGSFPYVIDHVQLVKAGAIIGSPAPGPVGYLGTADEHRIFGGSTYLPVPLTPAEVNAENFGVFLQTEHTGVGSVASVDSVAMTVYFAESEDESPACFAGRSMELRSNGVFRQHSTDDIWGPLVPDGFYPVLPAGGLEERPCRTILIPSTGDLEELPDSATAPSLSAVTYSRDGYHLAREAA